MIIKSYFEKNRSKDQDQLVATEIKTLKEDNLLVNDESQDLPEIPLVETADKTKIYNQLDSLIEHLKVYREEMYGTRLLKYVRSFIQAKTMN